MDRADRRHDLPQPLLVPHPGRRRSRWWRRWAGRCRLDARRPAGPRTGGARLGVAAPVPGRRRLRLRRAGQAPARLAGARPAARAVAARPAPTCRCSGALVGVEATPHAVRDRRRRRSTASIVPLLLWRRTRLAGVARAGGVPRVHVGAVPDRRVPVADDRRVDGVLRARLAPPPARPRSVDRWPCRGVARRCAARRCCSALAVAWVVVQLALPLRHLAYPGDHRWTGEGYRFAWNVLLVEKAGSVTFLVHEPSTGRTGSPTRPSSTPAPSSGS